MWRALPLLLLLLLPPATDAQALGTAEAGCPCLTACSRTIDSPFVKMCTTTSGPAPPVNSTVCGVFNAIRNAYWEACNTTLTELGASTAVSFTTLSTFSAMWFYMCAAAVAGVGSVYALVGLALVLLLARTARDPHSPAPIRNLLLAGLVRSPLAWLAFVLAGACHGLLPGALLAAILSFVYLCMPYAIDSAVAITLGLTVAAVALFFACNRGGGEVRSKLHAAIYE